MGKHVKRTLEEKIEIVKEYKAGASIFYLCKNIILAEQELYQLGIKNMFSGRTLKIFKNH